MKYKAYKLKFSTGVHFGKGTLEDTAYAFCADTLFSALCIEAVKDSTERLERLVQTAKAGKMLLSDALPYIEDTYYVPKPMCEIVHSQEDTGDSSKKKLYKKTEYIPYDCVEDYVEGEFAEDIAAEFHALGKKYVKVSAAVNGNDETVPYRVGQFYFNEGNGLYIILGYDEDAVCHEFETC